MTIDIKTLRLAEAAHRDSGHDATADLRRAKQAAHAAFDPIWKDGGMSRTKAYKWLSSALGITLQQCHIGEFDTKQCFAVVSAVNDLAWSRRHSS